MRECTLPYELERLVADRRLRDTQLDVLTGGIVAHHAHAPDQRSTQGHVLARVHDARDRRAEPASRRPDLVVEGARLELFDE
jgi:hypothetical protein